MKGSLMRILVLGVGMTILFGGCQKEDAPLLKQKTEVDIFSQVGSNPLIQQITRSLQQHGDTGAYRKTFVQEYGVPLWMKAKCLEQGGTYTAIVPLQEYGRSYLQGLWIFTIKDGKMRYNVAVNDACMPYYEAFKPFFCGIEQSLFNVRRDSVRYKEVVDPRKNGFWVTETYCYNYSVSWGAETVYKQSCYDRSVWVQLDDQHFPMDDGGGGVLDLPSTGIGSTGTPEPKPDPIIDEEGLKENPCVNAAWDRLKSTGRINSILTNFIGEKPVLHLDLNIGNLTNANGQTGIDGYWAKITIDNSYGSNATSISIARTFVHELIHAEMFRKLASVGYKLELVKDNFPGLWDYWVRYGNGNNDGNDSQHNAMAKHYREQIISILKSFDSISGIQRESSFYEAMSWAGLDGTRAWSLLSSLEKARISQILREQATQGGCQNEK